MKKRIYLLALLPFLLAGCTFLSRDPFDMNQLKNSEKYTNIQSARFAEYDLSFKIDDFRDDLKIVYQLICEKTSLDRELILAYNSTFNTALNLRDKAQVAMTKYYAGGKDQQIYKEKRDELITYYNEFLLWFPTFLQKAYESTPEIKKAFFGDRTNEEIEELIAGYYTSDEIQELSKQLTAYEDKASELINEKGVTKECAPEMMALYVDYIKVGNELASLYGYDNYLSYVFEKNYRRDFDEEKYDLAFTYYKQYLLPVYNKFKFRVDASEIDQDVYNRITSYNMFNDKLFLAGDFQNYATWMGGSYLSAYNHLFYDGLYCFTDQDNSFGTAFVAGTSSNKDGIAYFSKNNQDVTTLIHEFGHYHANYANSENDSASYDILETHSQANEYIFAHYLEEQYKDKELEPTIKYYVDYKLRKCISYIANMSVVGEVEKYVFDNYDKLSVEQLVKGAEEIDNQYAGVATPYYWVYPIVNSSGYYVSYATSMIASMEYYYRAKEDMELCKTNYLKFVKYSDETDSMKNWEAGNIYHPFDERAYQYLAENLLKTN